MFLVKTDYLTYRNILPYFFLELKKSIIFLSNTPGQSSRVPYIYLKKFKLPVGLLSHVNHSH